jgi:hypothetical protein
LRFVGGEEQRREEEEEIDSEVVKALGFCGADRRWSRLVAGGGGAAERGNDSTGEQEIQGYIISGRICLSVPRRRSRGRR